MDKKETETRKNQNDQLAYRCDLNSKVGLTEEIGITLSSGWALTIKVSRAQLIMAFMHGASMQWPLERVGVHVVRYDEDQPASLRFLSADGTTYHHFYFKRDQFERVVIFFKSWGFKHCDN